MPPERPRTARWRRWWRGGGAAGPWWWWWCCACQCPPGVVCCVGSRGTGLLVPGQVLGGLEATGQVVVDGLRLHRTGEVVVAGAQAGGGAGGEQGAEQRGGDD